eukprot:3411054-Rhodomonas_salina.1
MLSIGRYRIRSEVSGSSVLLLTRKPEGADAMALAFPAAPRPRLPFSSFLFNTLLGINGKDCERVVAVLFQCGVVVGWWWGHRSKMAVLWWVLGVSSVVRHRGDLPSLLRH